MQQVKAETKTIQGKLGLCFFPSSGTRMSILIRTVARQKIRTASAGDFIVVCFALIGSLGVAT
jgi:hypothetical protein